MATSFTSDKGPDIQASPAPDANCLAILVVDDSDSIRQLMVEKLRDLTDTTDITTSVETASSGEQAIEKAELRTYDLILMDVEMPGMGGLSACRRLKEVGAPRVAMLSSLDSGEAHHAGREAGCDNYLTKPPNDADLKVLLRLVSLRKQVMA